MVTKEDVMSIAKLSKLYLSEKELEEGVKEMNSIVSFAAKINDANYNYEPKTQIQDVFNAFRSDEIKESFPREEILKNVDGGKDGFFYIEKSK